MSLIISAFHPKALNVVTENWQVFWLERSLHLPVLFKRNSGVREVAALYSSYLERLCGPLLQLRG